MKRRSFLKGTLLPFMPLPTWATKAAGAAGKVHKHYVGVFMYGAPARWGFDLPLSLNAGEEIIRDPMVINERNAQGDWTYATTDYKNYRMPSLWGYKVPGTGNATRRPSDLLEHSHIIRGVDVHFDGHPISSKYLMARSPAGTTFTGILADASPYLFSHLALGNNPISRSFVSPSGKEGIILTEAPEEVMEYLLRPFQRNLFNLEEDGDLEGLMALFGVVYSRELSNKKIEQILKYYKVAYERYNLLSQKALRDTVYAGINDRAIESKLILETEGKKNLLDAAFDFSLQYSYFVGPDMRVPFKNASLDRWPSYFAFAETLIKFELCNNIVLSPPTEMGKTLVGLEFSSNTSPDFVSPEFRNGKTYFQYGDQIKKETSMSMDSHEQGAVTFAYGNALFYAAMSTCLLEFVEQLKSFSHSQGRTAFDQTLIHLTAEFGRQPVVGKAATFHDTTSHVSTLISGMIPQFHVSGDLGRTGKDSAVTYGAGVKGGLEYSHVMSTVAQFLGIRSLIPSGVSLVKKEGHQFSAVQPMGRLRT